VAATDSGWVSDIPLHGRTIRCVASVDGEFAIRRGRRTRPWAGNVLAFGDAAVAVEPLYGLNLALVHRAIFLALELLPSREFNPLELTEFNRRWHLITDQVRDLIALLYMRNGKEIPDSLARRIDQYQHRGRLPFQEDEVLNHDDWTSALIGMGKIPRNVDPAAGGVPLNRATDAMKKIADELAQFAAHTPAYPDYLGRITDPR
jgi:tryptophan halogenase